MTGQLQCISGGSRFSRPVFRAEEIRERNRRLVKVLVAAAAIIIFFIIAFTQAGSAQAARADQPDASRASIAATISSLEASAG